MINRVILVTDGAGRYRLDVSRNLRHRLWQHQKEAPQARWVTAWMCPDRKDARQMCKDASALLSGGPPTDDWFEAPLSPKEAADAIEQALVRSD